MVKITGIPFDSPLYEIDAERGVQYVGCEALAAVFTVAGEVGGLLPTGLRLSATPALGALLVADYPMSTLGAYHEVVSLIQVVGPDGELGMYVPYIYVTNDAALAAGREVLGAPKKLARISLERDCDVLQGTMERPAGKRLLTFTMKPTDRAEPDALGVVAPAGVPMYSLRQSPALPGQPAIVELVRWYSDVLVAKGAGGEPLAFSGPASITFDSPSAIDPIHRVGVGELIGALWMRFDMALRPGGVVETTEDRRVMAGIEP
ncbi:MAG TPA: acetoacetate decarboxylase family protein [Acidimicrobiales bacterium]|nr:acetoacetate decarboxylase family protein [Acidimicrobiales bacterium]